MPWPCGVVSLHVSHPDVGIPPMQAMKKSVGLPVAVQCVALPWQEELCLRFMREVERLMTPEKRPS